MFVICLENVKLFLQSQNKIFTGSNRYRIQTRRTKNLSSTSVDKELWKFCSKWPGCLLLRTAEVRRH